MSRNIYFRAGKETLDLLSSVNALLRDNPPNPFKSDSAKYDFFIQKGMIEFLKENPKK